MIVAPGFDTATEVALLATTALYASRHVPWYAIICLPVLFTAGMALMDTTDGLFMNVAYGWAFFNPVRKVYYNLSITGLSVAICFSPHSASTAGNRRKDQPAVSSALTTSLRSHWRASGPCDASPARRRISF